MALTTWALGPALRLCAAGPACSWEMLHVAGAGTFSPLCFSRGCWVGSLGKGKLLVTFSVIFLFFKYLVPAWAGEMHCGCGVLSS